MLMETRCDLTGVDGCDGSMLERMHFRDRKYLGWAADCSR